VSPIRVLIADDQALVRGALATLLGLESDLEVVAQVGRGDEVLDAVREHTVDVALVDIDMPGRDGLAATAEVVDSDLPCRCLIVTTFGRPGYLSRGMEAGAAGFIVKDTPPEALAEAIRKIAAGLRVIDYFLSDEICIPRGDVSAEAGFTEQILRLPHSHLCYAPEEIRAMPETSYEAPVRRNGYVTFGSFNNFAKVTDEILLLWRGILESVRGAKLVIKGKIASIDSGLHFAKKRLSILNYDLTRVEFRPFSPDYLEQYRDIDIALDTAPYNGGLTTCEALYMGVPVIALRGRTHGARFGASILTNAGVRELVAENDINYVRRAVQLAESPKLIDGYHAGLRTSMKKSPLMDIQGYMNALEAAYEEIWKKFCAVQSSS